MSMTKTDYELIASVFKSELDYTRREAEVPNRNKELAGAFEQSNRAIKGFANRLALKLQADNPKFNRDKFLKACGIEE